MQELASLSTSEKPYAPIHAAVVIALRMLEPEWTFHAWSTPEKPNEVAFYTVRSGQLDALITIKT